MADDARPAAGGLWLLDANCERCVTDHLRSADIATSEVGATFYYLVDGRVYEVWVDEDPTLHPATFCRVPEGVDCDLGEEAGVATVPPMHAERAKWRVPMRWDELGGTGWLLGWHEAKRVEPHG